MWVFIEEDQIEIEGSELELGEQYLYEPYFNDMKSKLKTIGEEISTIEGRVLKGFNVIQTLIRMHVRRRQCNFSR